MRHLVANNIKQLIKFDKRSRNSKQAKNEWNIFKKIKQKVENNNLIITQAEKGGKKCYNAETPACTIYPRFLNQTQFTPITHDPTKTFQRKVQTVINKCKNVIKNIGIDIIIITLSP
jgi:hypothetical protein